jgi:Tol biopolymer transport system component
MRRLALALATLATLGAPASDGAPSANGRLVVAGERPYPHALLETLAPSGGGARVILHGQREPPEAAWTPHGTALVMARDNVTAAGHDNYNLWTSRPDGSHLRQLTRGLAQDHEPAVSPDGRSVAFVRHQGRGNAVYTIGIDGHGLRRLTALHRQYATPVWSPDGRTLAVTRWVGFGVQQLYLIDVRTRALRPLYAGDDYVLNPSWSPDGSKLVYLGGDSESIDILTLKSGHVRVLLRSPGDPVILHDPVWSPDGRQIAFVWQHKFTDRVATVRASTGRDLRYLTPPGNWYGFLGWASR